MRTSRRHPKRGIASLIMGFIGIWSILAFFMANGFAGHASETFLFYLTLLIIPLVCGLLAIFLALGLKPKIGPLFKKAELSDKEVEELYGLIGLILGIACVMIGILLSWGYSVALHT